jgi:large conductance mechanosensitive channel
MKGFKEFILRGNVLDLAVAVVLGAAFGNVISSFVRDLLTPLIAALGGQPNFSSLYFTVNNSRFMYGEFINSIISFLIVGTVIYFFVVVPMSRLLGRSKERAQAPSLRKCPECLSDVPLQARRCAFCAVTLNPVSSLRSGS